MLDHLLAITGRNLQQPDDGSVHILDWNLIDLTFQLPIILTRKLSGKRLNSNCEIKNMLDTKADCSIIGILEV